MSRMLSFHRWAEWTVPLLLLALGLLVYAPSFNNAFVLDDEGQVLNNPAVQSLSSIPSFFAGSSFSANGASLGGIYYKPLMMTAYSLFWWVGEGEPWAFHLWQLLLAVGNATLVWLVFRRHFTVAVAAGAALVFLAHPLNSETVLYVADLQDILYTFFGLLAVWWMGRDARRGPGLTACLGACLLASLFSKESGILYVLAVVGYAVVFFPAKRRAACVAALLAVTSYLSVRLGVAHLNSLAYAMNQIGRASLETRLLTAPRVLQKYLLTFAWPAELSITQDWVVNEPSLSLFWAPLILLSALLIGCVAYGLRLARNQDKRFLFFAGWVFVGMGFHSHIIVPLDGTYAERWVYFTVVGLLGLLATLVDRAPAWRSGRGRVLAAMTAAVVIAALATRSWARGFDWQDNYVLSVHDLSAQPDNYYMHNNVGVELFRRGQLEAAKLEFVRSTELAPQWDINWNNLAAVYQRSGDLAQAETAYLRSLANGNYFLAYEGYASLLVSSGRRAEAIRFIRERALPRFPADPVLRALGEQLGP